MHYFTNELWRAFAHLLIARIVQSVVVNHVQVRRIAIQPGDVTERRTLVSSGNDRSGSGIAYVEPQLN